MPNGQQWDLDSLLLLRSSPRLTVVDSVGRYGESHFPAPIINSGDCSFVKFSVRYKECLDPYDDHLNECPLTLVMILL